MSFKRVKFFVFWGVLLSCIFCFWIYSSLKFLLISLQAETHIQKGQFENAFDLYQTLQKKFPKDTLITKKLGDILAIKESYAESIRYYKKSLQNSKKSSTSSEIYHNWGNVLFKMGSYSEAAKQYKESLRLHNTEETKWNLELSLRIPSEEDSQENKTSSSKELSEKKQSVQKIPISKSEAESILQSIGEKTPLKNPKTPSIVPIENGNSLDKNW